MTLSPQAQPLVPPPTLATLQALPLRGMEEARRAQPQRPAMTAGPCEARRGLLVARAMTAREERRLQTR
jgi:hypothetical protein